MYEIALLDLCRKGYCEIPHHLLASVFNGNGFEYRLLKTSNMNILLLFSGLQPCRKCVVHGWWTKNKMKISKSAGNAFEVGDTVEEIGGKYGMDAFRCVC
jgi:hypothetical protein